MTFYEQRFPTDIGGKAVGGPMRIVDLVTLRSGYEEANAIWQHARRQWDVSYGIKKLDDLHTVIQFWEAMGGRLHTFRFKDPSDWKSCAPQQTPAFTDQTIGTGDGAETEFQLIKVYAAGSASYSRDIKKPVASTVKVGVNGAELTEGVGYTVDTTTGVVTLTVAAPSGHAVTAGFEYDVPVRFMDESLSTQIELYQAGSASINMKEVRV